MITRAILIPFFTERTGGPYDHITEISLNLEKLGIKTKIYSSSYITQKRKTKTVFFQKLGRFSSIYRFNSYLKFREYRISLNLFPFLLKDVKNIDIFHSNALRSYQESVGALIALSKKKPFIITPHGAININWDYSDKIPKMVYDKTIGFFTRKLLNPHFIAVARNEIPVIRKYGIDDNYIHYIPHGVNTEVFKPQNPIDFRKKYGLEGKSVLLFVGRIAKGKGVDKLIKILRIIVKKNKNITLLIVGNDAGYLPTVKSLIQKYNLSNHVIITGFIPKKDLPKHYSLADLVIYPSRQEIFGMVLIEAGACGKPVIGSDIMGPSEIIVDGKTGYTSNFKDLNQLSELILDLLDDQKLLIKMGKNNLKRVKESYSWKKAAVSHFNLYRNIMKQ